MFGLQVYYQAGFKESTNLNNKWVRVDPKKSACRYCRDYKHVIFSSGPTPFLRSIFTGPRKPPVPLFLVCRPIVLLFVLLSFRPMMSDIANGAGNLVFRLFSQLLSSCLPPTAPPPSHSTFTDCSQY